MCQINLDMRQDDIFKATGNRYDMPILYLTQLMGLCLGMSENALGLNKLIISPKAALNFIRS
jgi:heterodisulfide reductase subunit B